MIGQQFSTAVVRENVMRMKHQRNRRLSFLLRHLSCFSSLYEPFVTATIGHTDLRILASSFNNEEDAFYFCKERSVYR